MRLDHPRVVASGKTTRAGFTVMEILLALSLTVVIVGVMLAGVLAYTRANTANAALESVNVTAKVLEDQLRRDLTLVSRVRTFTGPNSCPAPVSPAGARLWLLNALNGEPYLVEYVWVPDARVLERRVGVGAPGGPGEVATRVFDGVATFHVDCLRDGQVVVTAVVQERVQAAAASVGQRVDVRVTSAVRMR